MAHDQRSGSSNSSTAAPWRKVSHTHGRPRQRQGEQAAPSRAIQSINGQTQSALVCLVARWLVFFVSFPNSNKEEEASEIQREGTHGLHSRSSPDHTGSEEQQADFKSTRRTVCEREQVRGPWKLLCVTCGGWVMWQAMVIFLVECFVQCLCLPRGLTKKRRHHQA